MAKLAVIALLFVAGILLRRIGWLDARHGVRMLRIVANIGLPALIIGAIGSVPRQPGLLALPASAVAGHADRRCPRRRDRSAPRARAAGRPARWW
jgi:predicted permease